MKAWRVIEDGTEALAKNRRLHLINGVSSDMLDPVDMPAWPEGAKTVADYDELNAQAALVATELETKAGKIRAYVSEWERMTPDQQNRSLILAIADRIGIGGPA